MISAKREILNPLKRKEREGVLQWVGGQGRTTLGLCREENLYPPFMSRGGKSTPSLGLSKCFQISDPNKPWLGGRAQGCAPVSNPLCLSFRATAPSSEQCPGPSPGKQPYSQLLAAAETDSANAPNCFTCFEASGSSAPSLPFITLTSRVRWTLANT